MPMTAEQQLERSVLEGKERDELHAIAQALSVKTNTRTKKADMIDGILKATGVSVDGGPAGAVSGANGDGTAPSSNGDGTDRPAPTGRRRTTNRAASSASANGSAGESGEDTSPDTGSAEGTSAESSGPASVRQPAVHSFGPADDADEAAASIDLDDELVDVGISDKSATHEHTNGQQADQSGPAGRDDSPGTSAGQQGGDGRQGNQSGGNGQGNNRNQNNRNQNNQNNQNRNQNNQNRNNRNNQGGGSDDVGNRRSNRRRRGRDRQGGGAEGDLQGAGGNQDQQYQGELIPVRGLLDLRDEGYGFLRCEGYLASTKDVYVSISQAPRFALRKGDSTEGFCRPAGSTEKYPALLQIDTVSSLDPEAARNRPRFEDLTPLFPDELLHLER